MLNHLRGLKGRDEDIIVVGNKKLGCLAVYLLLEVEETATALPGCPL